MYWAFIAIFAALTAAQIYSGRTFTRSMAIEEATERNRPVRYWFSIFVNLAIIGLLLFLTTLGPRR